MKKKSVFALMMAMAMVASVAVPATVSQAAGLAQAQDASKVTYRYVSAGEAELLKEIFDVEYYKAQNPELVEVLGDNYDVLFEHFYKCGIFEGRVCNANFDPSAYASAYTGLRDLFSSDILLYYVHYLTYGAKEDRTITTMEACAKAGITVTSLVDDTVKIDPQVYYIATNKGIKDFKALQKAINILGSSGGNSGSSDSGSSSSEPSAPVDTVFVRPNTMIGNYWVVKSYPEAYDDARGLELVDTLTLTDEAGTTKTYYIYKDTAGVAIYNGNDSSAEVIYSTEGYSKDSTIESSTYIGKITARISEYTGGYWKDLERIAGNDSHATWQMSSSDKEKLKDETLHVSHETIGDEKENPVSSPVIACDSTERYISSAHEGIVAYYTTDYVAHRTTADGIYTDGDNWRKFNESDGLSKSEYAVEGTFGGEDEKNETPYDVGFEIVDNSDTINVVVGISNTETRYAEVYEFKFPVPETTEDTQDASSTDENITRTTSDSE